MTLASPRTILALIAVAALGACERHEWEDTKVLFQHGDHGDSAHGGHDAGHGDHDGAAAGDHGSAHEAHSGEKEHAEPAKH